MVSARVDRVACLPLFYRVQMLAGSDLVFLFPAGADKKAEAGAGSATEFQFVSIPCHRADTCAGLSLWLCTF
jgi:hypothetical protein